MSITEGLFQELRYETPTTRKVLERIPDSAWDWQPHEKSMSMAQLASHVAEIGEWMKVTLTTDEFAFSTADYKPWKAANKQELLAAFDDKYAQFRAVLADASEDALIANWRMLVDGHEAFNMPRLAVIRSMGINHMVHHRGQLTVYLRLQGAPVPAVYGPSADEEPPRG